MTEYTPPDEQLFRPFFLGDKFPTFDYYVELVGTRRGARFFFAQVKATTGGYTARARNLRVKVARVDVARMLSFPAPTYVFGIDERGKQGFLLSVNEGSATYLPSLSTRFPLNRANLHILWKEVESFWDNRNMVLRNSQFR